VHLAGELGDERRHQRDHRVHRPRRAHASAPPARRLSPTWARSSARRPRCSRPTSACSCTCGRPAARPRLPDRPVRELLAPDPEVETRSPERHYDRVIESTWRRSSRTWSGRTRPTAPADLAARRRVSDAGGGGLADAMSTALIGSCTNSSYEDMSRAADIAGRHNARGSRLARLSGHAGLGPDSRHHRARRPDAGAHLDRRHRARQRLRAVHRAVAASRAGCGTAEHDRHLLQPQLPGPQRRPNHDHELHREPRDRHRARARRTALLQPAHRHAHRCRRRRLSLAPPRPRPKCPNTASRPPRLRSISPPPPTAAASHSKVTPQRAAAVAAALAGVGRTATSRHAGADQDEGQDHHRCDLARGSVAALPRPPRKIQRQPASGAVNAFSGETGKVATC
jgi:hypothetical protein